MPRRDAQVHKTISRMMRTSKWQPPIWYPVMLAYPPTLPPPLKLQNEKRRAYDLPPNVRPSQLLDKRPVNIVYPEDRLRKQFFKDHPFEAFRARSIVESAEVQPQGIAGEMWERLAQRGRNPSPEDCIQFTLNLHQVKGMALSDAYREAVHQYRALRAEHAIMLSFACQEADAYGAEFKSTELTRLERREAAELKKWKEAQAEHARRFSRSKKWRADPVLPPEAWSEGEAYMARLRAGGGPALWTDLVEESEAIVAKADAALYVDSFRVDGIRGRHEDDEPVVAAPSRRREEEPEDADAHAAPF
ncbi:hypothetical protein CALVIDRAFT_540633 [Calocera viscosa TUFC12733]|uniref:Small ribosomal subunit protein mS23 n=1 Tax=Calocera viscosa (strain TUFC12733) TaxID=1330018 RepID=A0A167ILI0_CALVF|nr:hypothetical protein CALVIDRAFT_540633 [Calocera viscosa TUFC12733]